MHDIFIVQIPGRQSLLMIYQCEDYFRISKLLLLYNQYVPCFYDVSIQINMLEQIHFTLKGKIGHQIKK